MLSQINDHFVAENASNVEASLTLMSTVFATTERFAALNLNTARALLQQSVANVKALQEAKDTRAFAELQASHMQPTVATAISYAREVNEIAAEIKEQMNKLLEVRASDAHARASGLVDKALKSVPGASEASVANVRTALDTASAAYASMSMVAKQMAETADANVAAASQAAFVAADSAAKMIKKRA